MNRWKFKDIKVLVKWIFSPETLDREDMYQKPPTSERRFGKGGFVRWLLSADHLDEEPEVRGRESRLGRGGFLGWLLSADDLQEEALMVKESSLFGEKGFFRWLVKSDKLQDAIDEEKKIVK
jgi:hypothetical protein